MVMSVASYHLWLDWRASGAHLARSFTDYEPGIHWPQAQMQSGSTGINIPRINKPVKQGHDQDPTGAFIRAWLPELAAVPDAFVHEPWKWPGAQSLLDHRYPAPIVDVVEAARAAREAIWGARRRAGFAETAAGIVQRHASRAPRRRAPDAGFVDAARCKEVRSAGKDLPDLRQTLRLAQEVGKDLGRGEILFRPVPIEPQADF